MEDSNMKLREKNIALVAAGIVLGTAVTGPAVNAAEMLASEHDLAIDSGTF